MHDLLDTTNMQLGLATLVDRIADDPGAWRHAAWDAALRGRPERLCGDELVAVWIMPPGTVAPEADRPRLVAERRVTASTGERMTLYACSPPRP